MKRKILTAVLTFIFMAIAYFFESFLLMESNCKLWSQDQRSSIVAIWIITLFAGPIIYITLKD